jgi:hypothetical protein
MAHLFRSLILLLVLQLVHSCIRQADQTSNWLPADSLLMTRWGKDIDANNILPEYPRPQMAREEWQNLNGLWDYAILPKEDQRLEKTDGKILVPFPLESSLSGVRKDISEKERLWYKRTFKVPEDWQNKRILLNFGAVDWRATVWVNGKKLGVHEGGYDAFSFDITDALIESNDQEVVVAVWDPTEDGHQARGKQIRDPHGFWYTAVTGIWQTVWLEPVEKD